MKSNNIKVSSFYYKNNLVVLKKIIKSKKEKVT